MNLVFDVSGQRWRGNFLRIANLEGLLLQGGWNNNQVPSCSADSKKRFRVRAKKPKGKKKREEEGGEGIYLR